MASGGRVARGSRPRARAESVVVPFPRRGQGGLLDPARLAPSARSLLLAFALLAGAVAAYVVARETALFAVHRVEVEGAPLGVGRQVEAAVADADGKSLLAVDLGAADRVIESLPTVAAASLDRAFPHTLRIRVTPERAVAVVRQGAAAFVISARGRVMREVELGTRARLARIWVPKGAPLQVGSLLEGDLAAAARAATPLAGTPFPPVVSVEAASSGLTLHLRSGLEVRLGDAADVDLKLAVARRVLPLLRPGSVYLDVSVPERPVAGSSTLNSLVEVEGTTSTSP
ncbi:MAG: FtsQ-type POTRA domain-containing protein [Thermoleophilia bacterium]|nr:FtsQ-type POTRA domain-containing protein [Thermoleophilia bacterium]